VVGAGRSRRIGAGRWAARGVDLDPVRAGRPPVLDLPGRVDRPRGGIADLGPVQRRGPPGPAVDRAEEEGGIEMQTQVAQDWRWRSAGGEVRRGRCVRGSEAGTEACELRMA